MSHFIAENSVENIAITTIKISNDKYRFLCVEVPPEKIFDCVGIFRVE
ncbi:MAG: hypothetical protein XD72_2045 [Methanothrix harundinacea]|jgi:hypothetical protein|uniref:Uncharacterized protein n=1 Tax=Methanothrix harundinacea TaxID=301375 RepID=A0A101FSA7_9EURY|nr:MAG: hypothetical protein XD72_2045 [Methanothrix harundinacea]